VREYIRAEAMIRAPSSNPPQLEKAMTRHEPIPLSFEDALVTSPKLPKGPIVILAFSGAANVAWILWLCWLAILQVT
jgi:hypothetical protein